MSAKRQKSMQRGKKKEKIEKAEQQSVVPELNHYCLAKIFKYLPILERLVVESVCELWREASTMAWNDIKELDLASKLPPSIQLEELGLYKSQNQYAMRIITNCGRYLTKLKVGSPALRSGACILPHIGEHCSNLKKLEVYLHNWTGSLAQVFDNLDKLESVVLAGIDSFLPKPILLAMPESLTDICLSAHLPNTYSNIHVYLPRMASSVFAKFKNLKVLTLKGFDLDHNFMKIISEKRDLTHLSLLDCIVKSRDLICIQELVNLEYLNLSKVDVQICVFMQLALKCHKIQSLIVKSNKITDFSFWSIHSLPKLDSLEINSSKFTGFGLNRVANLKRLICTGCFPVDDYEIIRVIRKLNNLEFLNVADTNVSRLLLVEAAKIMKDRKNGVRLEIVINERILHTWDPCEDFSCLLTVTAFESYKMREDLVSDMWC